MLAWGRCRAGRAVEPPVGCGPDRTMNWGFAGTETSTPPVRCSIVLGAVARAAGRIPGIAARRLLPLHPEAPAMGRLARVVPFQLDSPAAPNSLRTMVCHPSTAYS